MYRRLIMPLLAQADAEQVHDVTMHLLARISRSPRLLRRIGRQFLVADPRLQVTALGLRWPNPLGVAAGLDKQGIAATALGALGFGHVEIGTVTPQPQPGNARPRVFRLPPDDALINRMGFPGVGAAGVMANVLRLRGRRPVLGINLGANRERVAIGHAIDDYLLGLRALAPYADYLAINVSSPNTARLRELQGPAALMELLTAVIATRDAISPRRPVLLKIAPDLTPTELDDLLAVAADLVDGVIATNTTVARPSHLRHPSRVETGGLSGRPLGTAANTIIRRIYRSTEGRLPIIGVGGVFTAQDAWQKLLAGATLVQLYTGFIYGGPTVAARINRGLLSLLDAHGVDHLGAVVGQG